MTAGLPVGIAAWLRVPVSFFLTILLLASAGEASAAGFKTGGWLSISITSPVTGGSYSTPSASLAVAGQASDNRAVTKVTWSNDRGGQGLANGTETWVIPSIQLVPGINQITVTAYDGRGHRRSRTRAAIADLLGWRCAGDRAAHGLAEIAESGVVAD